MALRGHHFFDATTNQLANRLGGLLPSIRQPQQGVAFKPMDAKPADAAARKAATAIYAGETKISANEFADLSWLNTFALSGRQLLMCHALTLLQGWTLHKVAASDLEVEANKLRKLTTAAPNFVVHLHPTLLAPLAAATSRQIQCVQSLTAKTALHQLLKAEVLLEASRLVSDGFALNQSAVRLFEQALPQLVAADGGPLQNTLQSFEQRLDPLFNAPDIVFSPLARSALDRALPFLSMLVGADSRYCFETPSKPSPAVLAATPLQWARHSNVVRLQAGKAVVVVTPENLYRASTLCISSHGHHLFDAAFTLAGPHAAGSSEYHQSHEGQLAQQTTHQFTRTLYANPLGDDVRVEDAFAPVCPDLALAFTFNADARISVARGGTQATVALPGKNLWQLTLRGAALRPTHNTCHWQVHPSGPKVNWALKRIARNTTKLDKQLLPELPF
jgi:Heparinase II/III-like protein